MALYIKATLAVDRSFSKATMIKVHSCSTYPGLANFVAFIGRQDFVNWRGPSEVTATCHHIIVNYIQADSRLRVIEAISSWRKSRGYPGIALDVAFNSFIALFSS